MTSTILSYPIPAYQNVPIQSQYYVPSRYVITALSLGTTTTVTTSVNHNYVIGQEIRLLIPQDFGSYQLNETSGFVTSIPNPNQVVVTINSQNANAFIASSSTYPSVAQILAIGEINSGQINSSGIVNQGTFIPGSFINVSPN